MAAYGWSSGRPLNLQIQESSGSFDFYQLVRLLEMETKRTGSEYRFRSDLDHAFPAFEIKSLQMETPWSDMDGAPGRPGRYIVKTSNYCIAGYSGPLPESYQNWVMEKSNQGEMVMADFLNIFNHRINYLRFDSRSSSIQALDNSDPTDNILADDITGVMGMFTKGLFEKLTVHLHAADSALPGKKQKAQKQGKRSLMALAGLISSRRVGAHLIGRILQACFRVPIKVRDLVGGWKSLASDQVCNLGVKASRLGELCLLGTSAWDMNHCIRTSIGPVDFRCFVNFLPGFVFKRSILVTRTFALFREFARFITNRSVDVEVELLVDQNTIEPVRIFSPDKESEAVFRLGLSTWLGRPESLAVSHYRIQAFGDDKSEVGEIEI